MADEIVAVAAEMERSCFAGRVKIVVTAWGADVLEN
jgi:hypothetical protein